MSATAAQIAQVRRMVAEPTTTTYSDATIQGYIETYPLRDERGQEPYTWLLNNPPTQSANPQWIATYDLHAAAHDIWDEKAALLAGNFDFSADGAAFSRSQAHQQAQAQARYYAARRKPRPTWSHVWPTTDSVDAFYLNAPEDRN